MIADDATEQVVTGRQAADLAATCRLIRGLLGSAIQSVSDAPPSDDEDDDQVVARWIRRRARSHLEEAAERVEGVERLLDPEHRKAALEEVTGKFAPVTPETLDAAYIAADPHSARSRGLVAVLTSAPPGGGPAKVVAGPAFPESFADRREANRCLTNHRLRLGLPPLTEIPDVPRGTIE